VLSQNEFLGLIKAAGSDFYPPDDEQAKAVYADPRADLFIVAGPGTGKTSCLSFRALYLIFVAGVPPRSIMATTFTRKAAAELRSRLLGWGYRIIDAANRTKLSNDKLELLRSNVLDDLERLFPSDGRRGRIILKRTVKKPILEYVLPELAKYEGRVSEIAGDGLVDDADDAVWLKALSALMDLFKPIREFSFRVGRIDRVQAESDRFVVLLTSYSRGRVSTTEVVREYADVNSDRLETYEVCPSPDDDGHWLDIYPFLTITGKGIQFYNRTRAIGYEYRPIFGDSIHVVPTKRKFSHAALDGTIASDRQILFWTPVVPVVSAVGVRANIPAHDPTSFVGRKQQITDIMEEVIQIPNENGLLHGPGGVGKTSLLIELSRKLFEEGLPVDRPFKNVIWVSAKRNYYDPTLDVVEPGTQQFRSLDQIVTTILEFHGFESPDEYDRQDQRWLVLELLREEKTLLILDNFETVARTSQDEIVRFFGTEVKRYLKDKPDNFKVLLTSREVIPSGFHQIQLKGLDKRESNWLMERLDQPYRQSAQPPLTEAQRNQLYEVTKGIPLIIKHCYGQFFEYNIPPEIVLKNLASAGNKVVEFSFSEIFRFLKEDELQKKIIILLELANRPTLIRQISDILSVDEADIAPRITNLANFQCIIRSPSDIDDKYSINPDVQLLTAALVHDSIGLADEIRHAIARLATEKRIDYSKEEFECFALFQHYVANGQLAQAEDFIKERLKERPNSILFNLHYAKYIKEQKRQPAEAISRLESIRKTSGNDPQVLRLLMMYNIALEPPNFDVGHIFAKELEKYNLDDADITMDIAEFYTEWATNVKLKLELDPIKEMLRQQKYKELSDHAISLLESCRVKSSHKWHYLLAQCQFNKWDYTAAKLSMNQAIAALPRGSYLKTPYERFRDEIVKKGRWYYKRR
jgi:GTPase SAR1 family protein